MDRKGSLKGGVFFPCGGYAMLDTTIKQGSSRWM